jgi:hypothetical protein
LPVVVINGISVIKWTQAVGFREMFGFSGVPTRQTLLMPKPHRAVRTFGPCSYAWGN